jgi:hypothetical protein
LRADVQHLPYVVGRHPVDAIHLRGPLGRVRYPMLASPKLRVSAVGLMQSHPSSLTDVGDQS